MKKGRHDNCENWEYKTHPQIDKLRIRSEELIELIRRRPRLVRRYGFDTRKAHSFFFALFAPKKCPHFAGHYRGYPLCQYLKKYRVGIGTEDTLVGAPYHPEVVERTIQQLEFRLSQAEAAFEVWVASSGPKPTPQQAVSRLVVIVCDALETFLTIHPYANGNGHCGRLMAWAMFARQGFLPLGLPLDERPPYEQALYEHRRGRPVLLQLVMLQALKGWPGGSSPSPTSPSP